MKDNIDIISIGESIIELYTDINLTYAHTFQKSYSGDALITAITAKRLGSKVGYITKIANDPFKNYLLNEWHSEGLDISQVKTVEGTNGLYIVSNPKDSEKEFIYYRKKTASTTLSPEDIPEDYIERASIVYSTGITQSLSDSAKEAVKKAFQLAKEKQCLTAYDPNYIPEISSLDEAKEALEDIIDYIDIIILNTEHDAEKLFGFSSPDKIIKFFWDRGISTVAIKMGKDGCQIGYNGEINHQATFISEVIDTTGAGDSFNGGFLHGIASGYTPFESARLASIVASFQVRGAGSVKSIPNKESVYAEFKHSEV